MKTKYFISFSLYTRKKFYKHISDMYNYYYDNNKKDEGGDYTEITEEQANYLETLKHFQGEEK